MITSRSGDGRPSRAAARRAAATSWAAALAFVAALVCLAPPAAAVNKYWTDGSGQWDVADNWTPSGQPQVSDSVYLTQSDATDRVVTYTNTTNPEALLNSLTIDATGDGTMTLNMPNDHPLSVNFEYVGYDGQGALTQSAGTHGTDALYLGYGGAGEGTFTITGGTLSSSSGQYVGYSGTGTLNIQAGGQLSNYGEGYLGYAPGSTGTATVTGAGSAWTNWRCLYVGLDGTGTLTIEAGGQVSTSWEGYVGYSSTSTGTATVTGAGSAWANSSDLYVGYNGAGSLTVTDGGRVTAQTLWASPSDLLGNGTITAQGAILDADLVFDSTHGGLLAAIPFGAGGTLNVSPDGTGSLGAGYKGAGTLRIADGLTVASIRGGYLGYHSGSAGTATVTGNGSTWTNRGNLYVGYNGSGALNIEAGGQVSISSFPAARGYLGYNSGSTGTVTVTGDGSTWTNSGNLYVGYEGTGTLNIVAGGQVSNAIGNLGFEPGSTGAATVTGAGSTWANSDSLFVGSEGTGTLTVTDGGLVSAKTLWASLSDLLGNGTIEAQGAVVDADVVFDSTHGLTQALPFGTGGTLNLNVDGSGRMGAGYKAVGTLRIADGFAVASTRGYLGYHAGSTATATVTGAGSTWTNSDYLLVGYYGAGTLTIEAGGQVSNTWGYLGYYSVSTGVATVTGDGSTWTNSSDIRVGSMGTGTLSIEAGGQVSDTFGYLGSGSGSEGTATVTGAGSTWTHSKDLYVGNKGTGTLKVEAGGHVDNTNGYLGYESGSSGQATVDGIGSVWNNTVSLYVGGKSNAAGGTGSLTVRSGGQVVVVKFLRLWTGDSTVVVNGGTLACGALGGSTGTVRITDPAGGTALTVGSATSDTFSAALRDETGPGSLTKIGTGTQTLSGAGITYTGTTTVLAGKLRLSNATAFASGILNSAATEFAVSSGTWTFGNALRGAGAFVKSGTGTLHVVGPQDYDPGAAFDVLGGVLALETDAGGTGLMADAHLALSVTAAELRFGAGQHLDTLTVGTGGKVLFAGANRAVMRHVANTGAIDLATAALLVDYEPGASPLADVAAWVRSGLNAGAGYWDGPGIASSEAAADPDHLTAVGVLDNTDPKVGGKTTFEGEAVDATSVLVKYTWWGDANLDGVVDANDYDIIDLSFILPPEAASMGWWTGDFTYDGAIDANDYDRIDKAYLFQTGPLASGISAQAATPEPATLTLLVVGILAVVRRRMAQP